MNSQYIHSNMKVASVFNFRYFLAFAFFNGFLASVSFGQLTRYPLPKTQGQTQKKSDQSARTQAEKRNLPFWDDFSKFAKFNDGTPTGKPHDSLWVDSKSVWVNDGLGINPPSINVATLDGLDSLNQPYEATQILATGYTDKLVSVEIDLVSDTESSPVEHRDSIYLRYFYQWMGNGEAPNPNDFVVVEFKNSSDEWVVVRKIQPEAPQPDVFVNDTIHLSQSFIHDAFQFRFRRYGRKSGPFDTWNIDYVYLNYFKNVAAINDFISISDRALTTQLSSFFAPYTAIPYKHWIAAGKLLTKPGFGISNLTEADPQSFNYKTTATVSNFADGSLINSETFTVDPLRELPPIAELGRLYVFLDEVPDVSKFDADADSVIFNFNLIFNSGDNATDYFDRYDPISFKLNDIIKSTTTLHKQYAYDDGKAEYAARLSNPGNAAAILFEPFITTEDLVALHIYFPDYGVESNQTVDLTIYDDIGGVPGNILRTKRSYIIERRGLNKFARIPILATPVGSKFYIGWTEPSNGKVRIGLDTNTDNGSKMFVKAGHPWAQNTTLYGALMIRAEMGDGSIVTDVPEEKNSVVLYPNPNSGTFLIRGKYDQLTIMNTLGQSIAFQTEDLGEEKKITLQQTSGLYLVQIQNGKSTETKKIVVK